MPSDYWDSCLFIEVLQRDNKERLDECESLLAKAKRGEAMIVTSTWTIVEVNKLPKAGKLSADHSKKILEFFENDYIAIRQLDRPTAELAHELIRVHGLKNADAVHVATALLAKVDVFYTYDDPKHKRSGLIRHNLKIGTPPLRIERPPAPTGWELFDKPAEGAEGADDKGEKQAD